jgi:hypothetical protein
MSRAETVEWIWQTYYCRRKSRKVVLFYGLGNHVDLRGLPGGGRSPAKPVSGARIPCYQGKEQGISRIWARFNEVLGANGSRCLALRSEFPKNQNRELVSTNGEFEWLNTEISTAWTRQVGQPLRRAPC